ncbi:unnamed protein product [Nyctereutes procyonoides]|uniref:(raccoon dog) hypothetical protein n=1 Tax=Nyctereutes procyonoides TaxID=34880 RepID=A0A812A0M6_NYCPR|nr:unnamed protein product [Nyctereutes procyonoides]
MLLLVVAFFSHFFICPICAFCNVECWIFFKKIYIPAHSSQGSTPGWGGVLRTPQLLQPGRRPRLREPKRRDRWTCRHCCQKCEESSYCQSSEDEVEILGRLPAQPPPWLVASWSSDKDRDSVHTAGEVPLTPWTNFLDRRCSSSAQIRLISHPDHPTPHLLILNPSSLALSAPKKEPIQPSMLRRTYTPDNYFRKFKPQLYSLDSNSNDVDFLTDKEVLSKDQLDMLRLSTQYDLPHSHLTVRVIEARDLPPPISHDGWCQDMAHWSPYVKICLLPDQRNSNQAGVKCKTQKPVFEGRYTVEIPLLGAQRRSLLLTMVNFDKFSHHCVTGKVLVPLCQVDLVEGGPWWKVLLNSLPSAGRLNVDVIGAKSCLQTDVSQGSDPFVKIQLVPGLKLVKTKKTSFLRGTIDPFYNESFSFKVPQEELENASSVFTVFGHNMKSSNDFIGRLVIAQYSSGPSESSHCLRSPAECDRVSPALLEVT